MGAAPPFDIKAFDRDWIQNVPAASFAAQVAQCAAKISAGDRAAARGVLIAEPDPIAFAAAFFAAVHVRVPVILGNPRWGQQEWTAVAGLVDPAVIFGDARLEPGARREVAAPPAAGILIPTGGSSGGVKFAVHHWATLVAASDGLLEWLGPGAFDACCVLPLYHVSGLMQLVRSFLSGGRIAFPDFETLRAGDLPFLDAGALYVSLVPTQLQRLIDSPSAVRSLKQVKAIFLGGASAADSLVERARALELPIVMSYGLTETAAMVAALPSAEFAKGHASAGYPLGHADIQIVGADGANCCAGEPGRIRIKARSLFRGYLGGAELAMSSGFWTGDEGFFDSAGRLHIIGRIDRIIISGGEKIDPREVEQAIRESGMAEAALVVGWPDSEWGQKTVAFYTPAPAEEDAQPLKEILRAKLTHYKVPKVLIRVSRLPLNERGKIDRARMQKLIEAAPGSSGPASA